MSWSVDASDVHRMTEQALSELRTVRSHMARVGNWAAAYERRTHPYTNRTYNLQRSTRAVTTRGQDEVLLMVTMGMFYASYVNRLGYSNIDEAITAAKRMLDAILLRFGEGL